MLSLRETDQGVLLICEKFTFLREKLAITPGNSTTDERNVVMNVSGSCKLQHSNQYDTRKIYPPFKLEALSRFMIEQGLPAEAILAGTRLDVATLNNIETRVSFDELITVWRNIADNHTDPLIALKAGQSIHISTYGIYGYVLLCAGSIRRGIESAIRYHELVMPTTDMSLQVIADRAHFRFEDRIGEDDLLQFNLELQISLVHSILLDTVGQAFRLNRVHFSFPGPQDIEPYSRLFNCEVVFNQRYTEMIFDAELLDRRMPQCNLVTEELVRARCEALIAELTLNEDFLNRLRAYIRANITRLPGSEEIARQFSITSRTLRRRLMAVGTSFQAIVDQIKKEQALILLLDTDLTIDVIAERLGFSDAANFRRAFKRWTNSTPGEIRESFALEPELM